MLLFGCPYFGENADGNWPVTKLQISSDTKSVGIQGIIPHDKGWFEFAILGNPASISSAKDMLNLFMLGLERKKSSPAGQAKD